MIFAFINNELRGVSVVKNNKEIYYFYLEVKWNKLNETSLNIDFYTYISGSYYSIDGIIRFGDDEMYIQPSEVTSDFGIL